MKKIIFFLVVIVLILNTKNVYSFGSKSSNLDTPQVVYPFKNADKFSDKANLLEISTRDDTNGKGNTYLINYNLSEGKNSKQYILLNENVPSVFFDERFISVKQDNSGFFVGTKETLFEFNSKIELKRKINIDEFKLEDNDSNIVFEFGNCAKVFNNNLYLMVNKCQYVAPNSKTYRTFVAEWDITLEPKSRKIANIETFKGLAVDGDQRMIFTFGTSPMNIYNFEKDRIIDTPYGMYDFIDFDKDYGMLLSNSSVQYKGEKSLVIYMKNTDSQPTVITEGLSAAWGYEGKVYYCDYRFQLWRCDIDGNNKELLLSAPSDVKVKRACYPPKFDSTRKLLAFNYTPIFSNNNMFGTILINLENNEYINLSGQSLEYNKIDWLICPSEK